MRPRGWSLLFGVLWLMNACAAVPTGGIVKLTAERKNNFHAAGISGGYEALVSHM
jgi:hypothetical protein